MKNLFFFVALGVLSFLVAYAYVGPVQAGAFNPFDIQYPIVELGNCSDQQQCKAFCDDSNNAVACMNWAEKNGLVSKNEAKKVRAMREMEEARKKSEDPNYNGEGAMIDDYGPGGCKSPQECDQFCRKLENLDTCLDYSVDHGFMDKSEADKIKEKSRRGGPGGCKSPQECDQFCRKPENMRACMQFAVDDGKISQEEADFMVEQAERFGPPEEGAAGPGGPGPGKGGPKIDEKKAARILTEKGGPGGCKTPEECKSFCDNPDNMETCTAFAVENGLMPKEEAEKAMRMMKIGGPGGCKSPQECDQFCRKPGNGEVCMKFSIDNGLISPEDAERMKKEMEIAKKMEQKAGPGGCKGSDECAKYCSDPSRMDECMNFAVENGMMPKEEVERRKNEMKIMRERMNQTEMRQQQFMQEFKDGPGMPFPQDGFMPPMGPDGRPPFPSVDQQGRLFDGFNRQGPNPSQQGFQQGNFNSDRPDFQKFGDFGDMERKLQNGEIKPEEFEKMKSEMMRGPMPPADMMEKMKNVNPEEIEKFKKEMEQARQNMPPQNGGWNAMPYRPMDGQGGAQGGPASPFPNQGGFVPPMNQGRPDSTYPRQGGFMPLQGQMIPYNPQGQFGQPNESNPSPAPYPAPYQGGMMPSGQFIPQGAGPMPHQPSESNPSPAPMPTPSGSTQFVPQPMESNPFPAPALPTGEPMPTPTAPASFIYPQQSLLGTILAPFLEILR